MGKHGEAMREASRIHYRAAQAALAHNVDLDEYIVGVSKTATRIGKTKPYAVCYGGLYLTPKYEEQNQDLAK